MANSHRMTPARRAALKKAQAASARKRRGKGKGKLAASNRRYDARSRRTKRAVKLGAALAVAGGVGYAGSRAHSIQRRKSAAIKEAKTIQHKNRENFRTAKEYARKNPKDRKAQMRLKIHRRALRISSTGSVHRAIIRQHTGR